MRRRKLNLKKVAVASALLIAAVCTAVWQVTKEPTVEITVPVTVEHGDTMLGLADKYGTMYGDKRDRREIAYYAVRQNGRKDDLIIIGEKIDMHLEVPETKK